MDATLGAVIAIIPELVQGYGNEIDPEELFGFLKKAKEIFGMEYAFPVEKPTLHKELPEFVKEIKRRFGLPAVKLDTNGTRAGYAERLD